MSRFTQGIDGVGAIILKDGVLVTPEQIVQALNALDDLVTLKYIKEDLNSVSSSTHDVMEKYYMDNKPLAWDKARKSVGL